MFGNIFGKLGALKEQMAEVKIKLDQISIEGSSADSLIHVKATGNRKLTSFKIDDQLIEPGKKDELSAKLLEATNDVLAKAEIIYEDEMKAAAKDLFPNIPGMS